MYSKTSYILNYKNNSGLHATARNKTVQEAGKPRDYWWTPGSDRNFFSSPKFL